MIDAKIDTCIGSDYVGRHAPPRPLAPLNGLQMAVTHGGFGQSERVSVDDALRAFTIGSAAAEDRTDLGVIRTGMLADFVGLSDDPAQISPDRIGSLQVRFTVVGGRIVYEASPTARRAPPPTIGQEGTAPPTVRPPPPSIGPAPEPRNGAAPKK
jgi:predicted amidohydrolase YtcJ